MRWGRGWLRDASCAGSIETAVRLSFDFKMIPDEHQVEACSAGCPCCDLSLPGQRRGACRSNRDLPSVRRYRSGGVAVDVEVFLPSCAERRTANKQTFASTPPANESVFCPRRAAFQLSAVVRSLHAGPAASMMRCCTSTPGPGTSIGRMRSPATSGRGRRHLDWPSPPSRQRPFTRRFCFCPSNLHRTEMPHQRPSPTAWN
jgi:hypothetical protein